MHEPAGRNRTKRRSRDLAYVLGAGASVGRSRVVRDGVSVAPLVLINSALAVLLYFVMITRVGNPDWIAFAIVGTAWAFIPAIIAWVLVSLRDHEQPVTVASFVTLVTVAVMIAALSAARVFMSYSAVLLCTLPTIFIMVLVMLRLRHAQTERVAVLDFPGASDAVNRLGGKLPIIGGADAELGSFDRFLIDVGTHYSGDWSRFLLRSYMRGVLVTPWVRFLEMRMGRVDIHSFDLSDIVLRPGQILYLRAKRVFDIFGALVATVPAAMVGGVVYLYILTRAGRPVLFKQERRGRGGQTFTIFKFRTMEHGVARHSTIDNDKRILRGVGWIRKLHLDEIPQLINIWRGEMSWIGPRPAAVEVAEAVEAVEPKFESRLLVRPGLTGWAQVSVGYASTVEQEVEKLGYDLYYVKNVSFDLDLEIMAKTARIVLLRIGSK